MAINIDKTEPNETKIGQWVHSSNILKGVPKLHKIWIKQKI